MAKNTRKRYRQGAVRNRSQAYNRKNNTYVKRGEDGRFMDVKSGSPLRELEKRGSNLLN
ncbi:hypothetical protein [Caldifermentibacillus hisashii]|uniref:hypothetical protein n=1 Tax=Caldifermentibacillus hisashii TaxID=996558 RepID=UPI001C11D00B|nr:hypothetical protein [Caldifermentibacillus hisashii]MBU5343929.1 hypothetical protein [Caldifermentibacillus hisashii]